MRRALSELKVEGVPTPASLFEQIFNDDEFTAEHGVAYDVSTKWLERKYLNKEAASSQGGQPASMSGASEVDKKESSETFVIEVNNRRVSLTVPNDIVANLTAVPKRVTRNVPSSRCVGRDCIMRRKNSKAMTANPV